MLHKRLISFFLCHGILALEMVKHATASHLYLKAVAQGALEVCQVRPVPLGQYFRREQMSFSYCSLVRCVSICA